MCVGFEYWLLECEMQNRLPGLQWVAGGWGEGGGRAHSYFPQKNGQGFPTVTCKGMDMLPCLKAQTMAPVDFLFVELMTTLYMVRAIFLLY